MDHNIGKSLYILILSCRYLLVYILLANSIDINIMSFPITSKIFISFLIPNGIPLKKKREKKGKKSSGVASFGYMKIRWAAWAYMTLLNWDGPASACKKKIFFYLRMFIKCPWYISMLLKDILDCIVLLISLSC